MVSRVTAKWLDFDFQYLPQERVEIFDAYRPGGYHPIVTGDTIRARYHIVHKLGVGLSSTVWLARDQVAGRYVAIKIATASVDSPESGILRLLGATNSENEIRPGEDLIPAILDDFILTGPNGEHQCLVTAPAMKSIYQANDEAYSPFQIPVARAIAAQLTQAVAFLHSQGIVHGGM